MVYSEAEFIRRSRSIADRRNWSCDCNGNFYGRQKLIIEIIAIDTFASSGYIADLAHRWNIKRISRLITRINVCDQSCKDCTCSYYRVKHINGTAALITLRYTRYLRWEQHVKRHLRHCQKIIIRNYCQRERERERERGREGDRLCERTINALSKWQSRRFKLMITSL